MSSLFKVEQSETLSNQYYCSILSCTTDPILCTKKKYPSSYKHLGIFHNCQPIAICNPGETLSTVFDLYHLLCNQPLIFPFIPSKNENG